MNYWTFTVFLKNKNKNVIKEWLDGLPPKAEAKIDVIINFLKTQMTWPSQYFSDYKGYDKIYELRISHNNIEYRIFGCYGPGRGKFTLLIGTEEKGDRLVQKDAPKIAVERRKLIYSDKDYIGDYE